MSDYSSRAASRLRLRALCLSFIAELPAAGWFGTVADLEDALYRVNDAAPPHDRATVPTGRGITVFLDQHAEVFAEYSVTVTRTRRADGVRYRITPEA